MVTKEINTVRIREESSTSSLVDFRTLPPGTVALDYEEDVVLVAKNGESLVLVTLSDGIVFAPVDDKLRLVQVLNQAEIVFSRPRAKSPSQ